MTCFVSRPSGITLVKFHSFQVTIKTNLVAELKHQAPFGVLQTLTTAAPPSRGVGLFLQIRDGQSEEDHKLLRIKQQADTPALC